MDQNPDLQQYTMELQQAYNEEKHRSNELGKAATSMFSSEDDSNLIEFQLEMESILERMDHMLRGHLIKFDEQGNQVWQEPDDKKHVKFTEHGVQEILGTLHTYLNRNTILSNYDENTIKLKVYDIGYNLTDYIFMTYEDIFASRSFEDIKYSLGYRGKITEEDESLIFQKMRDEALDKQKLYMITVEKVVNTIHSAYLRALKGGERESLRTARTVTQTEPMGGGMNMGMPTPQRPQRSMIRPNTWFGR